MPPSPARAALQTVAAAALILLALELAAGGLPEPEPPALSSSPDLGPAMGQTLPGNPHLLWELAPGTAPVEGGTAHINELGMRDAHRGPPTRPRALVIGDSSVFGFGVDQHEMFTAITEERLQADVINAGVPGWSTEQARNMLELRGFSLEPDLLVIATLWSDNNFDRFVDAEVIRQTERAGSVRAALRSSALFRQIDRVVSAARGDTTRGVRGVAQTTNAHGRRRVPLQTYAENLEEMAQVMHDRGGAVAFLMLANRLDVQRRPGPLVWAPYRDAMRQVATRWGAPLVDLPDVFPRNGGMSLFLDEMHPNARGHTVIGRALSDALVAAGWPEHAPLRQTPPAVPLPSLTDPFAGQGEVLGLVEPERGARGKAGPQPTPPPPPGSAAP